MLISAAQSNGKIINYAKLERDAGVRHSQAERHFEILIDTLIGRYLEPFNSSIRKRQSKKSKFYFFDTGIVRALTSMAGESLNEFYKIAEALEKRWRFSYFRTKDDVEINLVIEKPRGPLILIEIKSSTASPSSDKLASFSRIGKEFKGAQLYCLSNSKQAAAVDGIECLYWADGLK